MNTSPTVITTSPPPSSSTGWIIFTVIFGLLFLVTLGFLIWWFFQPKCPTGKSCLNTTNPCPSGSGCLNLASPCPSGQTCQGLAPGINCCNMATCPVCVQGKPVYMWGFTSGNDKYSSLEDSDGVLTQSGTNFIIESKGGANQGWMLELDDPLATTFLYYIKNSTTGQYLATTPGTTLVPIGQRTSATKFSITPVENRQGRTYKFQTELGNDVLAVDDNFGLILISMPTGSRLPNNAEWMTSAAVN